MNQLLLPQVTVNLQQNIQFCLPDWEEGPFKMIKKEKKMSHPVGTQSYVGRKGSVHGRLSMSVWLSTDFRKGLLFVNEDGKEPITSHQEIVRFSLGGRKNGTWFKSDPDSAAGTATCPNIRTQPSLEQIKFQITSSNRAQTLESQPDF